MILLDWGRTTKTQMYFIVIQIIPQEMLRKYIIYARNHVKPAIQGVDVDKLTKLYSELRRESMVN